MRAHDISSERADIAGWSEPLIADCLSLAYRACLGDDDQLVTPIARQHRRLWSSLVIGDFGKAAEARSLLQALAKLCRLSNNALDTIDTLVLDELAEVVSLRYQGSPRTVSNYSRLLIESAKALATVRVKAA